MTNHSVRLTLASRVEPFELEIDAEIVPAATMSYSVNFLQSSTLNHHFKNLQLADPSLYRRNTSIENVEIILSAEFYEKCNCNETLDIESVSLRLTRFGWTISGPLFYQQVVSKTSLFAACTIL